MMNNVLVHLEDYRNELRGELHQILDYWNRHTVDEEHGGFYGRISNTNEVERTAPKGAVLNARILWSFAASYNLNPAYDLALADRAYQYIIDHFIDQEYGGVYWTVDHQGRPLGTKKQVYAVAFTIYALSEYFLAKCEEAIRDQAIRLYQDLVKHSFDAEHGGYLEAFGREWQEMDDLRLSSKDANEKKTMNTHLHVLEAFTNLYRIWPDAGLKIQITGLLHDFQKHIIDADTSRMILFFDAHWQGKSNMISYGHDIEASWLLLEAAELVGDRELLTAIRQLAVKMAEACLEGLDDDGSLWYEKDPLANHIVKEKHWWVQAEAMVGFYNAWQVSGRADFLLASHRNWEFVKQHILDIAHGEWFWGVYKDGTLMTQEDKVGLWKCPYHNSRACIELIKRIK